MGALGIRAAAAKSCPVSPAGRHFTKRSMVAKWQIDRYIQSLGEAISRSIRCLVARDDHAMP